MRRAATAGGRSWPARARCPLPGGPGERATSQAARGGDGPVDQPPQLDILYARVFRRSQIRISFPIGS